MAACKLHMWVSLAVKYSGKRVRLPLSAVISTCFQILTHSYFFIAKKTGFFSIKVSLIKKSLFRRSYPFSEGTEKKSCFSAVFRKLGFSSNFLKRRKQIYEYVEKIIIIDYFSIFWHKAFFAILNSAAPKYASCSELFLLQHLILSSSP